MVIERFHADRTKGLSSGANEVFDINAIIKQKTADSGFGLTVEPDKISIKSVLTTSNLIRFNSELNKLVGFSSKIYYKGTHRSEKPVMVSSVDNCES